MSAWRITLEGVALSGDCDVDQTALGTLSFPPEGLGPPALRNEDITYAQRDGIRHFADWYMPRILVLQDVTVCPDDVCDGSCVHVRTKVRDIISAWSRKCDDVELVIHTDCDPGPDDLEVDRTLVGPFGMIGRPRLPEGNLIWERNESGCATMQLQFDGVDHRLYVLDPDGTPGSGVRCVTLTPAVESFCMPFPVCFDPTTCFDVDSGTPGGGPVDVDVLGTLCVGTTITLYGTLTNPVIENTTTGSFIGYDGLIRAEDPPVIIDTETGTATQGGQSRTHLLTGDPRMTLDVGTNTLRLTSYGTSDDGRAEICFRDQVVMA